MTKEVLKLALEALEASARNWPSDSVIEAITAIKEALSTKCVAQPEKTVCPFCSSEWVTAEQHDRKMDRMEQERCVGCEACIDTACGRDECPKGWPKAAQPEQEPVALPCCGYTDASAVKWNPYNQVVQCHNCGQVYTTPPKRTWVGLSLADKEEYLALDFGGNRLDAMDWADQRLKEKNT